MKKDLMVWKNLYGLVRGGDETQKAKATLSSKTTLVRELFANGLRLFRDAGKRVSDVPWFVVVGEPGSGKTSLFAKSGLELRSSVDTEEAAGQPLVGWLGPRAYALDVSGRTFFDRWLKGSGAEWDTVLRCICRGNRHFPLSGIVLTLPADALLTDDAALTRKKASIIGTEFLQLLTSVGMNLPCHVVVTKADMLLGFREMFAPFSGREAAAPFGWQNPSQEGDFREADLSAWFARTETRLREGLMRRMLDPQTARDPAAFAVRGETAGAAYLFPSSLEGIRANLSIYLNRLFGRESWNGRDQLILSGVFLTSAEDTGSKVSPEFTSLAGRPEAGKLLAVGAAETAGGRFVGGLLNDFVFACRVKASFTVRELFRRQLPGYIVAALVTVLGCIWFFSAFFGDGPLHESLERQTANYRALTERIRAGDIDASPLIVAGKDGKALLLRDEALRGNPSCTRIAALCQVQMLAEEEVRAPFGYGASGILWFGFHPNLAQNTRWEIANRVQTSMVFRPAFTALTHRFKSAGPEPFSQLKREAMFDFCRYALHTDAGEGSPIWINDDLRYLMPEVDPDVLHVLATYHEDTGYVRSDYQPERYAESPLVSSLFDNLMTQFGEAWKSLEIYGETVYPRTRSVIRSGDEIRSLMAGSAELAQNAAEGLTNAEASVARWQADLARVSELRRAMDSDASVLQGTAGDGDGLEKAVRTRLDSRVAGWMAADPLKEAVADYRARLETDVREYGELLERMRKFLNGRSTSDYMRELHDTLSKSEKEVGKALDAEEAELRGRMSRLVGSRLLESVPIGTDLERLGLSAGGIRHYEVVGNIADAALTVRLPEEPKDIASFFRTMENLVKEELEAEAKLSRAAGVCTNDQLVAAFAADVAALMRVRSQTIRGQLLAAYARLHPRNGDGVGEMVASLAVGRESFGISLPLADEVFGGISAALSFDPNAAGVAFGIYAEMMALADGRAKDDKESDKQSAPPINLPNRTEIEVAMGEYVDSYIAYWGGFGDRLCVPCADWATFRRLCATLKPYEVNTLLAVVYRRSVAILSSIPKACLDARQAKAAAAAVTALESRLQMLTPHFSDVCIRQVTDWSLLPEDPSAAYRFLRECPAAVLVADYFAVDAAGAKGDVPWWTSFFGGGLNLLKRDARGQGVAKLRNRGASLLRFPFCADPVNPEPVRQDELDDILQLLVSCGFAPVALPVAEPANAAEGEGANAAAPSAEARPKAQEDGANRIVAKVRAPYRADSETAGGDRRAVLDYFAWGERMHVIVDTLRDRENETIWTLSLTPLAKSQELNDRFFPVLPLANYRYRYGELTVGGEERGGRVSFSLATGVQIARGTVDDADINLRLDAYSDPNDEVCVNVSFPGPWAILRLYLAPDSVCDAKTKTYDIPLLVRDRYDLTSVLWVSLKINRTIPKPSEWPTTASWPDIPLK